MIAVATKAAQRNGNSQDWVALLKSSSDIQESEGVYLITVTWQSALVWVLAACGGFSTICVAVGWLIKIIKGLRKPSKDVHDMLDNDNKRLKALEEKMADLDKTQPLILRALYVICEELKRGNDVNGSISKQQDEINDYLFNR